MSLNSRHPEWDTTWIDTVKTVFATVIDLSLWKEPPPDFSHLFSVSSVRRYSAGFRLSLTKFGTLRNKQTSRISTVLRIQLCTLWSTFFPHWIAHKGGKWRHHLRFWCQILWVYLSLGWHFRHTSFGCFRPVVFPMAPQLWPIIIIIMPLYWKWWFVCLIDTARHDFCNRESERSYIEFSIFRDFFAIGVFSNTF